MKKVIFFDIDGTIVTEDERALIPESTVRAIKKARENGNYTFINTGRTIFNVQDRIKNLGEFSAYIKRDFWNGNTDFRHLLWLSAYGIYS